MNEFQFIDDSTFTSFRFVINNDHRIEVTDQSEKYRSFHLVMIKQVLGIL